MSIIMQGLDQQYWNWKAFKEECENQQISEVGTNQCLLRSKLLLIFYQYIFSTVQYMDAKNWIELMQ